MSGLRRVRVSGTGRAPKRAPKRISLSAYAFTPDMRIGDWFRVVRIQGDATETSVTLAAHPGPATPGLRAALETIAALPPGYANRSYDADVVDRIARAALAPAASTGCEACGHDRACHSSGGMCDGDGTECYCVRFPDAPDFAGHRPEPVVIAEATAVQDALDRMSDWLTSPEMFARLRKYADPHSWENEVASIAAKVAARLSEGRSPQAPESREPLDVVQPRYWQRSGRHG